MGGDEAETQPARAGPPSGVGLPALPARSWRTAEQNTTWDCSTERPCPRACRTSAQNRKVNWPRPDGAAVGQRASARHGGLGTSRDGGEDHPMQRSAPSSSGGMPLQPPLDGDEVGGPSREDDQGGQTLVLVCMQRPCVSGSRQGGRKRTSIPLPGWVPSSGQAGE